jgi:hypothetical protein
LKVNLGTKNIGPLGKIRTHVSKVPSGRKETKDNRLTVRELARE